MSGEKGIMFKVKCAYDNVRDNVYSDSVNIIVGEKVTKWFDFLMEKWISNISLVEKNFILNYSLPVDNRRYREKSYVQLIRNNSLKTQICFSLLFIILLLISRDMI